MECAYFVQRESQQSAATWKNRSVTIYHNLQEFTREEMRPECLVIAHNDPLLAEELLKELRSDLRYYLIPMFVTSRKNPLVVSLSDGVVNTPSEALERAREIFSELNIHKELSQRRGLRRNQPKAALAG